MAELTLFFIYAAAFIWIFLLAEFSYRKLKLDTECTRKIVHLGTGTIVLTAPYYGASIRIALGLTILFTIIFLIAKKLKMFPAIYNIERESIGELLFAWSSFFLFALYKYTGNVWYFYVPFSMVVYADAASALVGKFFPLRNFYYINEHKSYGGSCAFFVVSFALSYYFFSKMKISHILAYSFMNAFILTLVEAFSKKGWDNLFISVVSVIILHFITH